MTYELGILGAGNMAEAIARGVTQTGLFQPSQLIAADVNPQRRELFEKQLGIRAVEDNLEFATNWRVIRTMPNTPMLVGEGMVGIAGGTHATDADLADARRIFEAAADVVEVTEDKL